MTFIHSKTSNYSNQKETVVTKPAVLVLADGRAFYGRTYGASATVFGEVGFTTDFVGYQELMTNPVNHGTLLAFAAPQIGNTGWNDEDSSSRDGKIWTAGIIIRDPSTVTSNWRATRSLVDEMVNQNVTGISHVDTRALVQYIRDNGSQMGGIFTGEEAKRPIEQLAQEVAEYGFKVLTEQVTTEAEYLVDEAAAEGPALNIVAVDYGTSNAELMAFANRGAKVTVVNAATSGDQVVNKQPAAVLLTSGPGNPQDADLAAVKTILASGLPVFGLGYGAQVLARALGFATEKLPVADRGSNIAVRDKNGKTFITAQNHMYGIVGEEGQKVQSEFGEARVSHISLNDGTVEGVALGEQAVGVLFDPATAAGAVATENLIDQFINRVAGATKEEA